MRGARDRAREERERERGRDRERQREREGSKCKGENGVHLQVGSDHGLVGR